MKIKARQRILTSPQITEARLLLGWSIAALAKRSKISIPCAYRLENPAMIAKSRMTTLSAVRTTLEAAGVIFSEDWIRLRAD
jgi:hypothetical protein